MLRHFDGNTAHELFDYLGDYHHIAVERAPEEKRPALDVIYETPPWLRIALKDEGVAEIKGNQHNNRILELFKLAFLPFRRDEVAWCSAAVCAWLESAGIRSTRSGMAKSFLRWGRPIFEPKRGAIVVFDRGRPESHWGHVALCTDNNWVYKNNVKSLPVFGGNQGDKACHKDYPAHKIHKDRKSGELIGIRWPILEAESHDCA